MSESTTLYDLKESIGEIGMELAEARSLLVFLSDYFSHREPKAHELLSRYHEYGDLFRVVEGSIVEQAERIESLSDTLSGIYRGEITLNLQYMKK